MVKVDYFCPMISIRINKEQHPFPQASSLEDMLHSLDLGKEGIAIAVNQQVVKRSEWADWVLENDDEVLIIKATQGG